jgi:hypothetical protein
VYLDVKSLAKIGVVGHRIHSDRRRCAPGLGYESVHVAIDDASRLAYAEVLADQRGTTAVDSNGHVDSSPRVESGASSE